MNSGTLEHILALGKRLDVQISVHGYEELAADEIRVRDVVEGLAKAVLPRAAARWSGAAHSCGLGYPCGSRLTGGRGDGLSTGPHEMGRDVAKETDMTTKLTKRLIREGDFVAEVDVQLVEEEGGWSPYLSLEDAGKLDSVRDALRAGDITRGAQLATRLYRLTPVEV